MGHYSLVGMGGARNVANRLRVATRTGASAFGFLQAVREKTDQTINEWIGVLQARNASVREIADEIVKRTTPVGGSQDEVTSRESMAQALEDLIERDPGVDFLNLNDEEIWMLIESFLGYEAFHRICLDIGQVFEDPSISARDRVVRMKEMRDYLKSELSAQVEELRRKKTNAASTELQYILQSAIENTFVVYEGEIS